MRSVPLDTRNADNDNDNNKDNKNDIENDIENAFFCFMRPHKMCKTCSKPGCFCSKDVQNLSEISFLSSDGCLVVMLSGQRESTLFISFSLSTVHSETKRLFL